jgi:pimeloyl-ACP methyl ester carboxylesterase
MKMLVCLHGNPFQGQEFEPLLPKIVQEGFQPIIHKRPVKGGKLEPLLQSISATAKVSGGTPFGIMAYSWGAYLALAYFNRYPENVTSMILINPLIIDLKPMACISQMMLKTPILKNLAMKFRKRSMAIQHVQRIFDPEKPNPETKQALESYLSQSSVWFGAAAYKKLMISTPLLSRTSPISIPVKIIYGEQDRLAPMEQQKKILQDMCKGEEITVPNSGHALPWTHPDLIVREVAQVNIGQD